MMFVANTEEYQAIVTIEPFAANRSAVLAAVARVPFFMGTLLFLVLTSCSSTRTQRIGLPESSRAARSMVATMRDQVEEEIQQYLGVNQTAVVTTLTGPDAFAANFKQTVVLQTLADPWKGMAALEQLGSRLAELAKSSQTQLAALIEVMERGMGRFDGATHFLPAPTETSIEEHLGFILSVLEQAHDLRDQALVRLSHEDRLFLFEYAATLAEDFFPYYDQLDDRTLQQSKDELRFARLVAEQMDYPKLVASAQVLAGLANDSWLRRLGEVLRTQEISPGAPNQVEGEVLLVRDTPWGQIVIGGPGSNRYDLDGRIALIIDLGGDDTYSGQIAAASDVDQGNRVVIDLAGQDTYDASPLGLATGRLGVGLLIDREGDDQYHLSEGSGGVGLAGLGLLIDLAGADQYRGAKLTQGSAIGGLGLLLDGGGDDEYTSFGYAIGFGGPLGVGALIDIEGDDSYQCGGRFPSDYNDTDAPTGDPEDPLFQYAGFCVGFGSGKRIFNRDPQQTAYSLAGGWGMVIDLEGNDHYRSANFSQGSGYFFGAGLKLDLGGNDHHQAARYGHGAAAHYAIGLFIDLQGQDQYNSSGPTYNGGTAWDRSVSLFIDAGPEDDVYDFSQSSGLGLSHRDSWSLFIEEGGREHYIVPRGFGQASDNSMSGFFDLSGVDEYVSGSGGGREGNGVRLVNEPGGLFVDRRRKD